MRGGKKFRDKSKPFPDSSDVGLQREEGARTSTEQNTKQLVLCTAWHASVKTWKTWGERKDIKMIFSYLSHLCTVACDVLHKLHHTRLEETRVVVPFLIKSIYLFVCLSVRLSIHPSIRLSIRLIGPPPLMLSYCLGWSSSANLMSSTGAHLRLWLDSW